MSRSRRYEERDYPREQSTRREAYNPGYRDDSLPQDYFQYDEPAVINMSPQHIHLEERRNQDADGSRQWASQERRRDDGAELLESLPSRQLEYLAQDIADKDRRNRRSKKSLYGTLRMRQGEMFDPDELAQELNDDPDLAQDLEDNVETADAIRSMTTTLSRKRQLKKKLSSRRGRKKPRWYKRVKYSLAMSWMHFKYEFKALLYSMELWKSHLKKIEGHFGTGVTSYFTFLRWLFLINIPIFLLTFCFVVLPQILYRWEIQTPKGYATNNSSFNGLELLTGSGWFAETEMYYGFYSDTPVEVSSGVVYQMKYAYLFTCGGYYLLSLFILGISIFQSYKKNYIDTGDLHFSIVVRVFCGWDYGITSNDATLLRKRSLYNEIKEFLSGIKKSKKSDPCTEQCQWFFLRVFTNTVVLALLGGSGFLVYFISQELSIEAQEKDLAGKFFSEMAMPLAISAINLILPFTFSFIGTLEHYKKPRTELYIGMIRTMFLKAGTLGVLVYFWYHDAPKKHQCWETFMGEEIYRLVMLDFLFIVFATFFIEFVRRLMSQHCCESITKPEFNIGRNTLNLIYSQVLCWLGTFYSPLLSLIMMVKLLILFYIKRVSVVQNCRPSLRPWRASRANTIFKTFLFAYFLLAVVAVACGILFIKPSQNCGPYRNYSSTYEVVLLLINDWEDHRQSEWVSVIINIVSSPGFIAGFVVLLTVGTYYMRVIMQGHKEMVKLLRQQLQMEGKDKAYLLRLLQEASERNKDLGQRRQQNTPSNRRASEDTHLSPGGKVFIKSRQDKPNPSPKEFQTREVPKAKKRWEERSNLGSVASRSNPPRK